MPPPITWQVTVEVRSPASGTITALFASIDDAVLVGADLVEIDVGVGAPSAPKAPAASMEERPGAAAGRLASMPVPNARMHQGGRPSLIKFGRSAAPATVITPAKSSPSSPAIRSDSKAVSQEVGVWAGPEAQAPEGPFSN